MEIDTSLLIPILALIVSAFFTVIVWGMNDLDR